ncbi:MAG TPA: PQQ-binding-like beta-propeller repeat protein [Mycobacteriales bacterium]|nr:PQQ-binding-like beta-propeller repeat protein [Mycobacteriales bacterium]
MLGSRRLLPVMAAVALVAPAAGALTSAGAAARPASCASPAKPGGDWPSYGHDSSNTRSQPAEKTLTTTVVPTLTKAWAFSAKDGGGDGDFTGTPVIAGGCMYIGSTTGWVFAVNADTGQKVWSTKVDKDGNEITSSPTVAEGQVFVAVGRIGKPYVAALDQRTGKVRWETITDSQNGADAYGSPVVFDGVLFEGVSGGSAELASESERYAFQGAYVLIETRGAQAGRVLKKVYTVQKPAKNAKQGGATVWSTPAVDTRAKVAYVGTGNPFHENVPARNADAVIKVDLDRHSRTFGDIIGTYDGTPETYTTAFQGTPCVDIPGNPAPYYPTGVGSCADMDMDFGASPNLIRTGNRVLVGAGQKSGYYHLIDGRTMKSVWQTPVGPPSAVGGIVGSTAYDGKSVYGPITISGYLWSLDRASGTPRWVAPIGDGAHWGNPVSTAAGIVYTVGLTGFLDAYDSATGVPLLHHWMGADVGAGDVAASWGGVAIARHTVYAAIGMTGLPNGYVIAYRPGIALPGSRAASPTSAAPNAESTVVSLPQAQSYGYATPLMVVQRGGKLQYANFDVVRHNVVQDVAADHKALTSGKAKWCRQFRKHQCPLFYSPLIGLSQTEEVLGVSSLKPGTYSFLCTLHPGMKGTLIVQ